MLKKLNSFSILAILTSVMVLLMLLTIYFSEDDNDAFVPLFPELSGQLRQINKLTIAQEDTQFTLTRAEGQEDWTIVEHYQYPANFNQVRRMMVDVSEALIVEEKTDNPEQHALLDLLSREQGGRGLEINFYRDDEQITGLLIGRERQVTQQVGPRQFFVRKAGEDQSWLVEGYLQFSPSLLNWLDSVVIDIARERIAKVDIIQPSGQRATIINLGEKDAFGTPDARDKTIFRYQQLGYDIAGSLFQLRMEDVQPIAEFSRGDAEVVRAEFLTYDGLKIISETSFNDGFYYSTFRAEADQSATNNVPEAIGALDILKDPQVVAQEIEQLNAQLSPWVYRVGGFVGTNLMRDRADIVTERDNVIPMPYMPGS